MPPAAVSQGDAPAARADGSQAASAQPARGRAPVVQQTGEAVATLPAPLPEAPALSGALAQLPDPPPVQVPLLPAAVTLSVP
jgi:hypothetical protein